ncbi:Tyrosine--tRNA ligase, cytoplasmic [Wickerhamiella sorbophila]|uniref:Tyrosine--tRNA ligase n=1 Tax=Wickerhamiella sorbophila TaxID=45607 RepID=A0A2T0FPG0_9ASCO|nr:Tyrosine--tRNA ligase, cytoplasmic [Wickerhamiella sorbophila]PRT56876.1 Tyrosine--tRNA ligase, cytoplasmic [Wickerhamiella sorbophila]
MNAEERLNFITRNLQEVLNKPIIEKILADGEHPRIYWGTAPTGKPHCGYLVAMTKLADFLKADCSVIVLLADLHAFLDSKPDEVVLQYRVKYYSMVVKAMLTALGVPTEKLEFRLGRDYQLTGEYVMDLFRMSNITSVNDAKRAGAEVVKQTDNPALSGLIYPLMQALDEEYLKVDIQFGGVDQRKIFVLAEEYLPPLGYKKRAHLMNPMVPGLGQGGKMSASDPNSKIDLVEDPAVVKKKISKSFAAPGVVEGNGLIGFVQYVILPVGDIRDGKPEFFINRDEKWGGPITYTNIEDLKRDYAEEKLSPADLKIGVTDSINSLLKPMREMLLDNPEFIEIEQKAYPPPEEKTKKVKKVKKDKGSRYPGGQAPVAPEAVVASAEQAAQEFEKLELKQ